MDGRSFDPTIHQALRVNFQFIEVPFSTFYFWLNFDAPSLVAQPHARMNVVAVGRMNGGCDRCRTTSKISYFLHHAMHHLL
mmetsp:Transcript_26466/g.72768  ORF Transcript_26466/g.72768 Transcript_26466/m.72768 type:complete len:81 (-) Transcript_26466:89-331(-)